MSEIKHTEGSWGTAPMVTGAKGAFYIVGNREGNNAEVEVATVGPTLSPRAEANARLIASAPELLEALEAVMNRHASNVLFHDNALAERCWNAIAKAKGTA